MSKRAKQQTLLIIIPSLHVGGAEMHLLQILPSLAAMGWQITVYLTAGTGELTDKLEATGITVRRPSSFVGKFYRTSKIMRLPILLLTFVQLTIYLLRTRPAIVQFTLTEAYLIGGLSCLLAGQRNLVMNRRSLNNYQAKYPLLARMERWLHTKMRYIIANSNAAIQQLQSIEQVPAQKLKLIYNGIDLQRFAAVAQIAPSVTRQQFNLPSSSFTLIVIANLIPYKGHATLLNALAQINRQLPDDWQLLCVGQKYPYVQELEQIAQDLNIATHVYFLGQQNAIPQLLAISNIAISCSYEEGFSNAIIEANAAGLPIIATNVGGNPEAVINDTTGVLVPARDAKAIATAILNLLQDPVRMALLGANGKQRVWQEFALDKCVQRYAQLYTDMVEG